MRRYVSPLTEHDMELAIMRDPWSIVADWYPDGHTPEFRAWRQFRLPCGIADIVIEHPHSYTIVEIKRDEITESSVGQLARYVGCFRDLLSRYGVHLNLRISACAIAPEIRPSAIDALYGVGDVQGWFIPFDVRSMTIIPYRYTEDTEHARNGYAWDRITDLLTSPDCSASPYAKTRVADIMATLETV